MRVPVGSILLPYEDKSMNVVLQNCIMAERTMSKKSNDTRFNGTEPAKLDMSFILNDSTYSNLIAYASPLNTGPDSVDNTINRLIELCYQPNGKDTNKQPNYLLIKPFNMPLLNTAAGGFRGQLSQMIIKTELVDNLGQRVKARVECNFVESYL